MQIGFVLPRLASWGRAAAVARRAEDLGLASLWLSDPARPYGALNEPPYEGLEALMALAGLAEITSRPRIGALLGAGVRPPAVAAKALATADVLSGGRVIVALEGTPGGRAADSDAVEETVQIMKGAFEGGPFTFHGQRHRLEGLRCRPRPLQRPGPAVWVVGSGERLFAAAARRADGWGPAGSTGTVEEYRRLDEAVDEACEKAGRDPATLTRFVRREAADTLEAVGEQVSAWEAQGVATLILGKEELALSAPSDDALEDHLEMVASVSSTT